MLALLTFDNNTGLLKTEFNPEESTCIAMQALLSMKSATHNQQSKERIMKGLNSILKRIRHLPPQQTLYCLQTIHMYR